MYSCLLVKTLAMLLLLDRHMRKKIGNRLGSWNHKKRAEIKGSLALLPKSYDVHTITMTA
jgi:hypothetical protein